MRKLASRLISSVVMGICCSALAFETGIGTHFQSYTKDPELYLKLIKQYGFTSFRDDYPWNKVESEEKEYKVGRYIQRVDKAFLAAKQYNLKPVVILTYGNKLYNKGGYPSDTASIKAFAEYAKWVAKRFKGHAKYYEIWNEWTLGTGMVEFRDNIPSARVYFNLVKDTSEAIRQADPDAIIIAGSINPLEQRARYISETDWDWYASLVKLGIMNYIDGVSLHTYSFLNKDHKLRTAVGNLDYIDKFHTFFSKLANKDISIYITEAGVSNYIGLGGFSQKDSAEFIRTYTEEAKKKEYIKGLWWYDLINDGTSSFDKEDNFGFFTNELVPKSSAKQIKMLAK